MMAVYTSTFRSVHQHRFYIHQAKKLRQYLEGGGCQAAHGSSPCAGMLERAAACGRGLSPCRRCGGDPKIDLQGSGYIPREPTTYRLRRTMQRRHWRSRGVRASKADLSPVAIMASHELRKCDRCEGTGWITRRRHGDIDAKPSAESHPYAGGHKLDDKKLQLLGRVGRWIGAVSRSDPHAAWALEAYFGPNGGNLRACWYLTGPGKTLFRQHGPDESPARCFDRIAQEQRLMSDWRRTRLTERADHDAERLLVRACALWNDAVPSEDEETEDKFWREAKAWRA
jgi:hypothetical protein